jgi:N-acylneuraminate cytidylyltransferase
MATIAFLPVRIGSKGIPTKNLVILYGKPLMYWILESLVNSNVDQIIVSGDSDKFKNYIDQINKSLILPPSIKYWNRDPKTATDEASTESAILDYLENNAHNLDDRFLLCQATNPWVRASDINIIIKNDNKNVDAVSVAKNERLLWSAENEPYYDLNNRPRRQEMYEQWIENGALYLSTVGRILKSKTRISGNIAYYYMESHTALEIDEPWHIGAAKGICDYFGKAPNQI